MFDPKVHIDPYQNMGYLADSNGYIVWRWGTGGNVEVLHLKASVSRMGVGRSLLREMLWALERTGREPYSAIFGFTRVGNVAARSFYEAMGFDLTVVKGVYADGEAVVFSQTYTKLRELHCDRGHTRLDGASAVEDYPVGL